MLYHRDILKVAAALVSTDETRPALQGVHVTDGRAEVTDGHQLVRFHPNGVPDAAEFPALPGGPMIPLGPGKSAILSVPSIRLATAASPKRTTLPVLEYVLVAEGTGPGKVTLGATDLDSSHRGEHRVIDMPFPRVAEVMPKDAPVFTIGMDVHLLARVFGQLAKVCPKTRAIVTLRFYDPWRAMGIEVETLHGKADGVIMPCRLAESDPAKS